MSWLKGQLRKMLPRLSEQANKLRDSEARKRLMQLRKITFSEKSISKACAFFGVSEDFYHKWGNRLLKGKSLEALKSKSRKPFRSPRRSERKVEKLVLKLRRAQNYMGPDRIADDAERLYGVKISRSTVYAILKRFMLISKRFAERLTKKHLKRYRRPLPGYLQLDIKYVPYKVNGEQWYQISCVDHHSSWRLVRLYRIRGSRPK